MKKLVCFIIVIVTVSVCSAQMVDMAEVKSMKNNYLGLKPAERSYSLLDLSRLQWSHSYSFNYFSGNGISGSVGMYTGSIFYEFSPKLSLDIKLGIAHDPASLAGQGNNNNTAFLPGFLLDYHPSRNLKISVGFNTFAGNEYYFCNPRYNPYRWRLNSGE